MSASSVKVEAASLPLANQSNSDPHPFTPAAIINDLRVEIAMYRRSYAEVDGTVRDKGALKTIAKIEAAIAIVEKSDSPFAHLVEAIGASHDKDHAPPASVADAVTAVEEHLDWIHINQDENDTAAVMIENVASMVAAAHRLADLLLKDITPEQLAAAIAENQP